jgi:molybdate transport system ATP-binding protein
VFGKFDLAGAIGRHEAVALIAAEVVGEEPAFALTRLKAAGAELVVPALGRDIGAKVRLRIRSQDVAIALAPPEKSSVRNVIPMEIATIDVDESAYAEILLTASGQHLRSRITRKSAIELGLKPGQKVFALIKSIAVEADRPQRG